MVACNHLRYVLLMMPSMMDRLRLASSSETWVKVTIILYSFAGGVYFLEREVLLRLRLVSEVGFTWQVVVFGDSVFFSIGSDVKEKQSKIKK